MKKLIALCLAMLMCLSVLAACGTTTPEQTTEKKAEQTTEKPTESESKPVESESETQTPAVEYDVQAAIEYLDSLYKKENNVTAADYEVVGQIMIGIDKYMVAWSVDNDKVTVVEGSPYWTIQVDEMSLETVNYKITATVTAPDGTTATVSYDRTVPEFIVTSFEDYMAAAQDDIVTVAGIVVAINAKSAGNTRNHLFLADIDGKGGYYCYQLDKDPLEAGVKVGMTVAVTAPASPYSGMQETKGGDFVILDETIKTVEPTDITDAFASGADLKNYVGLIVTVKGVTIGNQQLGGTSEYLYFELNGKKAYVRTYITDFPTTLTIVKTDTTTTSPDKDTIDADHAAHFGYTADVAGVLVLYSGAPYLIPVSTTPFTNYSFVEKTADEKVTAELDELAIDASVSSDKVIDLLATGKYYDDVTFTWATDDTTGAAAIADGKLTLVVPDSTVTVKVTVTATCGDVTKTKEFSVKLSKTITSIKEAMEIGAAKDHNTYTAEKYIIAGIIKEVYNAQYGNMYLVDELGNTFTVYGTYSADGADRYDAMESKPQAGDYVVILGVLGQYNGTPQMKNGWIQSFTTPITISAANELGNTFEKNQYTDDKKVITGKITEVQNTTYGNVVIADAEGNSILVYGLYSANGANRYDAMETKPVVGDTITVLGIVGKYNAPQVKNGWLIGYTAGAEGGEGTEEGTEETPVEPENVTIKEAIEIGAAKEHNTYTTEKYVVAGIIKEVYNAQYGNMYLVDELGNTFTVYGTYSADGADRYDAMESKPQAGDYVVILGALGQYNVTAQGKNGWIQSFTTPMTISAAIELGNTFEKNQYTEDKKVVTGTITEVQNTTYGNVVIADAEGNSILVYGLYSADGANRYDAMETKPVVGDTITVLGVVGKYNDPQVKNGWLIGYTAGAEGGEGTEDTTETPVVEAAGTTYVFSTYTAGEQYAANETHKLDDNVTVVTNDAHFTKQIRLYQSAANDWGPARSGTAIFSTTSAIKSFALNAGEKDNPIAVYGSTDGENWTLITTIECTTSYTDYVVDLGDAAYTFIKLAATDGQARVASVTIGF